MTHIDPFSPAAVRPQPEQPKPDPEALVVGTAQEVLGWVGKSKSRAKTAIDAELSSKDPRSSLVDKLKKLV